MRPISAGTEIRDKAGTLLATTTREIKPHAMAINSAFVLPDGSTPAAGTPLPPGMKAAILEMMGFNNG